MRSVRPDLEIPDGQMLVIVGLSGAGKSTLIRAINGLVPLTAAVSSGRRQCPPRRPARELREIRAGIGMIFQGFNLVKRAASWTTCSWAGCIATGTVALAARPLVRPSDVELGDAGAGAGRHRREGLGARRPTSRAASSSAWASRGRSPSSPTIILADEPVAQPRPAHVAQVMRDLQRINRELGITTIVNLHFLDLARVYGDRVIGLRAGELVYDGTGAAADEDVFRDIYGRSLTDDDILGARRVTALRPLVSSAASAAARPIEPRRSPSSPSASLAVRSSSRCSARPRAVGIGVDLGDSRRISPAAARSSRSCSTPNWAFLPQTIEPLIETFQMAVVACVLGCAIGLPLAFLASRVTAPGRLDARASTAGRPQRGARPAGPALRAHLRGRGRRRAAGGRRGAPAVQHRGGRQAPVGDGRRRGSRARSRPPSAVGASRTQIVRWAVLPQVLPNYVAFSLYAFELNIRASTVIGIVGAGGIGQRCSTRRSQFFTSTTSRSSCWSCSSWCWPSSSSRSACGGGWCDGARTIAARDPRRPSHRAARA